MSNFFQEWAVRILSLTLQGGLALAVALAISAWVPGLPALAKVWALRIALLKALLSAAVIGGVSVFSLPQRAGGSLPQSSPASSVLGVLLPIAFGLWAFSVAMGAWRYAANRRKLSTLIHQARPAKLESTIQTYRNLCRQMGIQRAPALLSHPGVGSPVLVKNGKTSIVLPSALLDDPDHSRFVAALAHELAHHKHRDLKWGWLSTVSDLLFFFHPLVKAAISKLRLYEEYAADAVAMRLTQNHPTAYSRMLLSFADANVGMSGMYAMSDGALELDKRIKEVYRSRSPRKRVYTVLAFAALAVGALALTPLGIKSGNDGSAEVRADAVAAPRALSPATPRL